MKKALTLALIVTALGAAAYFLKPSEEKCVAKAKEAFQEKVSYTVDSAPKEIDKTIFVKLLEKNFLQKLEVQDRFFYRDIYQKKAGQKTKIGWAAFGWVNVNVDVQ